MWSLFLISTQIIRIETCLFFFNNGLTLHQPIRKATSVRDTIGASDLQMISAIGIEEFRHHGSEPPSLTSVKVRHTDQIPPPPRRREKKEVWFLYLGVESGRLLWGELKKNSINSKVPACFYPAWCILVILYPAVYPSVLYHGQKKYLYPLLDNLFSLPTICWEISLRLSSSQKHGIVCIL